MYVPPWASHICLAVRWFGFIVKVGPGGATRWAEYHQNPRERFHV
jgi:hypothetical protein